MSNVSRPATADPSRPHAPIKLIGIDLDGTLLDSAGRLPAPNAAAVHAAVDAGIHVAIVTGRSYPFARPAVQSLPATLSLIVSSGAVERSMDGSTVMRRLLGRDAARSVLAATSSHRAYAALVFDRDHADQVVFESMDWSQPGRKGYWARNRALISQSVPLEDALTEDPIQVLFSGPARDMRGLYESVRGSDAGVAVTLTEYEHRDFSLIDITDGTATKGQALAWRASQLGLGRDQVMAIGDNFNDLDMLEYAGTPVVMANAVHALKDRGWRWTAHQDACGVAQAIQRYALQTQL
jgi:Cof subfamily protein (haloacid dehalogenase superfamily)